jgi:hypothetical protein
MAQEHPGKRDSESERGADVAFLCRHGRKSRHHERSLSSCRHRQSAAGQRRRKPAAHHPGQRQGCHKAGNRAEQLRRPSRESPERARPRPD